MPNRKIPPELFVFDEWPTVDITGFPSEELARYARLESAIKDACSGKSSNYIESRYGISRHLLSYYLRRCTSTHTDGRLVGFRALVKGSVRTGYCAKSISRKCTPEGAGYAGSFGQLLSKFEKTNIWLQSQLNADESSKNPSAGIHVASLHQKFLSKLRSEGCTTDEYPFTTRRHGYEALAAYIRRIIASGNPKLAELKYGETANQAVGRDSESVALLRPTSCFERVAYDEYQLPNVGTITIVDDGDSIEVPLSRGFFCPVVDFKSLAVLGYSFSISERFKAVNLLEAVECAINPPPPKQHEAFKNVHSLQGEGLPAAVVPQARGRRLSVLCVDNHLTHLANSVVIGLRKRTGVAITYGKVHSWIERYVVEGLFSELQRDLRRIPSTTGSGPSDPNVSDPVGRAVKYHIRMADLIALLDKLVARHNAKRRKILFNATANELIASDWSKSSRLQIVPLYTEDFVSNPGLAVESEWVTVRGDRAKHRTPYIQLDEVPYSNDILKQSWGLIGKKLLVHIKGDYRTVRTYRENGAEFGVLSVSGGWSLRPHSRETRREINRLYRTGIFMCRADDPVSHYQEYLAEQSLKKTKGKKSPRIAKESNALARTLLDSGELDAPKDLKYKTKSGVLVRDSHVKSKGRRDFFSAN